MANTKQILTLCTSSGEKPAGQDGSINQHAVCIGFFTARSKPKIGAGQLTNNRHQFFQTILYQSNGSICRRPEHERIFRQLLAGGRKQAAGNLREPAVNIRLRNIQPVLHYC